MPLSSSDGSVSSRAFLQPALVAGHPGHELKAFGWMSQHAPRVYLLTDGSGRHGVPRTSSTVAVIAKLHAPRGEIFGILSDAEIYDAILQRDLPLFVGLVDELAHSFVEHQIDFVAGDAAEGFNPTHDLCRALINSAVLMAERATGRRIANFEFCLTEWEENCPAPTHDGRCLHFFLEDHLLAQKVAAAQAYAELKDEVERAIDQRGREFFRLECFKRVVSLSLPPAHEKPHYELWGEKRVAEGEYESVIRLREHVLPIAEAMLSHAACTTVEALPAPHQNAASNRLSQY